MIRRSSVVSVVAVVLTAAVVSQAAAQQPAGDLRQRVEQRFQVLPLRDGVVLTPRTATDRFRSIEIASGAIAVDGAAVTGAELRDRLGADADLILQISYMDADARRALFGPSAAPATPSGAMDPAAPAPPPPVPPALDPPLETDAPRVPRPSRSGRRSGDRVRIGGSVTVDEDEYIDGDVVAVGGSAHVRGEVRGSVVAVGGSVELGPRAYVRRDVTVVGGALRQNDAARIDGEVHEIGVGAFTAGDWRWRPLPGVWWGWPFGSAFALMSTIIRVAVLCLLVALVVLLGREYVDRVSLHAAAEPLKAGGIGFLAQLLFLPLLVVTIVILVITIVGIPLLIFIPFVLLGLGIVALVGFTAVAQLAGRFISARMNWALPGPYATTLAGVLVLLTPLLLARLVGLAGGPLFPMSFGLTLLGGLVEYAAWTIGFGAAALARFGGPRSALPATAV